MLKSKINVFVIVVFIFGVLLGVLLGISGIGITIKRLTENKILPTPNQTPPTPSETPKIETRTVTGWVKFRAYYEEQIPFNPPPPPSPPSLGFPGWTPLPSETPAPETPQPKAKAPLEEYVNAQIPVENVLLAIVGQDGKIIKTLTTDKNGEVQNEITVPEDAMFSLTPKGSIERGTIHAVSFKEGFVETVVFDIPIFPNTPPGENTHDIILRSFDPNRRNSPVYYYRGSPFHVLDVVGFIQGVATALGLKPIEY